ncbi:sugar-binding domain-containing protein [Flammeovirga sp. SubArs3]|uniref:sugar-binding domain-containing protein n=1 Tax=Flammeovirga sp. SubArs3 TaxID=2995316 RepID=UPI00248B88BB|nr:sugar-binding domain-containing protein [Flammeovirga sp. SubArs3]
MRLIFIHIVGLFFLSSIGFSQTVRERISLDFDWKFTKEEVSNAQEIAFDDSNWRVLNVPHDWSIEGEYREENPSGKSGAFLPGGIGWYRKEIQVADKHADDKYFITFDGVYLNSDVWINGHHLGFHPNGYMSFEYDLTPYLKEGKNTLAVKVDHSKLPSGRWYTGSGIYRHVWLTKTKNIYIPQSGTFVTTPQVSKASASVQIVTSLKSELKAAKKITLKSIVRSNTGEVVSETTTKYKLQKIGKITQNVQLENPKLWSPTTPNMYTLESVVMVDKIVKDTYSTPFGIRKVEWKNNEGLFLNDTPILLKGLSNHQDAGALGVAVPNDVLYHRLKLLKEMGCNALRTAHHPFSPEFYAMCDTMGFMVMDEAFDGWWRPKAKFDYGNYFADYWQKDLEGFLKRDRNHPSVIMWSVGNEVHKFTNEEQKILVDFVKSIDPTRFVTQGRGYKGTHIDIAGFNGHGEFKNVLEDYHAKNPDQLIVGTEITHTLQTRGIYRTQTWYRTKDNPAPWEKPEQFAKMENKVYKIPNLSDEEVFPNITNKYQSSYDNSIVRIGVRDDWNRVEKYDYYVGNFRWTGFDYLGESFNWPARTANFGIIDLAGFPKDHYYLYQSLWSNEPMVHVLPHWNHQGKEGQKIPVVVYTNTSSIELFLNGKSLGEKVMGKERQLVWQVPYEKGEIKAIARNKNKKVAEDIVRSSGEANSFQLIPSKTEVYANQTDVIRCEVNIIDKDGVFVPDADHLVEFTLDGPAKILGVENGDILDLSSNKAKFRKVFNGKCVLFFQSSDEAGLIKLTVKSTKLNSKTMTFKSLKVIR